MQPAIVVANIFNNNGMATWCWEAAHALHMAGETVVLTVDDDTANVSADFPVIRLPKPVSRFRKMPFGGIIERLAGIWKPRPSDYLHRALPALRDNGIEPKVFLLNNGEFVDASIAVPQLVVAWAYPTTLTGYLAKAPIMWANASMVGKVHTWLDLLRFWRSDWHAYRSATGTLAVTEALRQALAKGGIAAATAYPGTRLPNANPSPPAAVPRLLMAAESLDDQRKGVRWMIDALLKVPLNKDYELLLAGRASDTLRSAAAQLPCRVKFLGQVPREDLQILMTQCDCFCFASSLDDWGYVLTEALASGMITIAPNQSPFDEMVGKAGFVYAPRNAAAFSTSLNAALNLSPAAFLEAKQAARQRAEDCLSSHAFARQLMSAIDASLHSQQGAALL